jgi:thymidylate kinase
MIIILEGIDGSGKTTLAEQLSRQTGYPIIHRSKPETEEDRQQMMKSYIDVCKQHKNAIFDRCWYSELAYGPVMRDKSVMTYPQMYELERLLAKSGAIIIYCTGSIATLWHRAHHRGEAYIINRSDFNEIYENYKGIMAMPHLIPVVGYEVNDA